MPAPEDILGGKYRLERLLGEGGMGQVFEARNLNTGRRVAVKTLHGRWSTHHAVVQRFLREARAATVIEHPNVVEVLDLDHDPTMGIPYIVQEYLVGESLEAYLAAAPGKRLAPVEALQIAVPVMDALAEAHRRGVVHRDLKPANIVLVRDRNRAVVPKVIDFGIAKLLTPGSDEVHTRTGAPIGTPAYMAPEQVAGVSDLDARADVWSMGVVLYRLLSGALPYEASTPNLILGKILYEPGVPLAQRDPFLPRDVIAVVDRALQKNREDRHPDMQSMLAALCACNDLAGDATPAGASAQGRKGATASSPDGIDAGIPIGPAWQADSSGAPPRTRLPAWGWYALAFVTVVIIAAGVGSASQRRSTDGPPQIGPVALLPLATDGPPTSPSPPPLSALARMASSDVPEVTTAADASTQARPPTQRSAIAPRRPVGVDRTAGAARLPSSGAQRVAEPPVREDRIF